MNIVVDESEVRFLVKMETTQARELIDTIDKIWSSSLMKDDARRAELTKELDLSTLLEFKNSLLLAMSNGGKI